MGDFMLFWGALLKIYVNNISTLTGKPQASRHYLTTLQFNLLKS